jgi:hypothetical protein
MEELAALMESCAGLVGQPGDWRKQELLGPTYSEETCSLVAFDALCTLAEFYHRRVDVNAALGWARRALYHWFVATRVGWNGDGLRVSC